MAGMARPSPSRAIVAVPPFVSTAIVPRCGPGVAGAKTMAFA